MNRKDLEAKDKKDLITLGESLGFKLTPAMSKADMVDTLSGASPAPVEAAREEDALPIEGALRDLQGNLVECRRFKVTILATEQDKDPAKLSVNGHMMLVRRGVEVVLAEPYVEVLKSAVINTVQEDANGKRVPVQIQRYPFMAMPI